MASSFPNDYALAIADTAGENDTADMIYVQIPAAWRSAYGLKSTPELMGDHIDVTGTVEAYFSHASLKSVTAMSGADPGPDPGTGEPDGYYDGTSGLTGS